MSVALGRKARLAAGASLILVGLVGTLTGTAYAAPDSVLHASATAPAPIARGGSGILHYEVTNTSTTRTDGVLLKISLPKHVSLDRDPRCQQTDTTPDGGILLSCNLSDATGEIPAGEMVTSDTPVHVDASAPEGTTLGKLGALVVPLDAGGNPTEDWKDLRGPNVTWTPIRTAKKGASLADLSVTVAEGSGRVGDIVTLKGTSRNAGPADVMGGDVLITAPTGTELVGQLPGCRKDAARQKFTCHTDTTLGAGQESSADLNFKIVKSTIGDNGRVTVSAAAPANDPNLANNTAPIRIGVTPDAGGTRTAGSRRLPAAGNKVDPTADLDLAISQLDKALSVFTRRFAHA